MVQTYRPAFSDRAEQFQAYAERRGKGEVEVPPHLLGTRERRQHVRNTLIEDHSVRLKEAPDAVEEKFAKLRDSAFSFFRGTALLYYRDHAGVDGHLPTVFSIGDVHPENFGIMPGADGRAFFSANDFDEVWIAPFTYDVNRGAVGFWMAGEQAGMKPKALRALVDTWTAGYIDALEGFSHDDSEETARVTAETAPSVLASAFKKASRSREKFLGKRIDLATRRFRDDDERIEPRHELVEKLAPVVAEYAGTVAGPDRPDGFFTVHDVALRHGSGTASQGLERFWVLLEGWGPDPAQSVIVEMKLARRSALYGLVPEHGFSARSSAERITYAHSEFLTGGDALYGAARIDGASYLVRERSPMKVNMEVALFGPEELREYATVCARTLAQLHARGEFAGGDANIDDPDRDEAERKILAAMNTDVFDADVLEFVEEAVDRVHADHQLFCEDFERGAFSAIERSF